MPTDRSMAVRGCAQGRRNTVAAAQGRVDATTPKARVACLVDTDEWLVPERCDNRAA